MENRKLSQIFQRWLFVCVLIAFVVSSAFTYIFQTQMALSDTGKLLNLNLEDVQMEIHDASDKNLLELTHIIKDEVKGDSDYQDLSHLAEKYDVSEINIIDSQGQIIASTNRKLIGFEMASGEQSAEFLVLLNGETEYVQEYQAISYDSADSMKYAGVALPFGGFVQVGYNAERFQKDIDNQVVDAAKNRHVGQNGMIIISDFSFKIVSDNQGYEGDVLDITNIWDDYSTLLPFRLFEAEVRGVPSYCAFASAEGYYIIAVLPQSEAMASRNTAVHILVCMEILVFAVLFVYIYYLINRLIIRNLQKVNKSLAKITGGDLEEIVNVRANEEFASLSDDINSTVGTLKHYIKEAETRIAQELEYARVIQYSVLPSVFPPYPHRTEFDIFALMEPAKEVGGDFYDFYLLGENQLAFVVADVSGKGIPAAMFMMRVKTMLKNMVESGCDLAEAFVRVNNELCEGNDADMFATAWMGILDVTDGRLEFVNAGHNPPLIRHKGSQFEFLKTKPNLVLAMMEDMPYKKYETVLLAGDEIFLYTDGVTEAQNDNEEMFGEERLIRSLNGMNGVGMKDLCSVVKREIHSFAGGVGQFDDITMLAVKMKE